MIRRLIFSPLIFLLVVQGFSTTELVKPPPSVNPQSVNKALDDLYNLDYDSAFRAFDRLIQEYPSDPTGYFGRALAEWWLLEMRLGEFTSQEEKTFLGFVDETIKVAKETLHRDRENARALLCLGGAYGIRGRWEAYGRHWFRALGDGRRARRYQAEALAIDPHLEDAYLGVGLFDYYVAALPKVIQVLSFLGSGDRERGLNELRRAATQSVYSRTAARLLLISIDTGPEKRPWEALEIVGELRREYPQSPFMRMVELLVLFENRKGPEMEVKAQEFLGQIEAGVPHFSAVYLTRVYAMLGCAASLQGKWREAVNFFTQAIDDARPTDPYLTGSLLYRGEAYDVLGQRSLAVADYQQALKGPSLWDYKKDAERYLRHPYDSAVLVPLKKPIS